MPSPTGSGPNLRSRPGAQILGSLCDQLGNLGLAVNHEGLRQSSTVSSYICACALPSSSRPRLQGVARLQAPKIFWRAVYSMLHTACPYAPGSGPRAAAALVNCIASCLAGPKAVFGGSGCQATRTTLLPARAKRDYANKPADPTAGIATDRRRRAHRHVRAAIGDHLVKVCCTLGPAHRARQQLFQIAAVLSDGWEGLHETLNSLVAGEKQSPAFIQPARR